MEVTWLGGTAFRLRGRDAAVATDPHTSDIKQPSARPKADLVTLSEPVADVPYDDLVRPNKAGRRPFVADGPGEYEVAGVYVHGVAEHNGTSEPATTLYTIEIDRLNVGSFSRLTEEPSDALLDELGGVHVLLINVDGGATALPPERIIHLVNRIEPNIVVPYGPNGTRWEEVARELGGGSTTAEASLSITRARLPEPVALQLLAPRTKKGAGGT